jgi:hypothetical protein
VKQRGNLFVGISTGTSKCRCQTRCGGAVCRVGARVEVAQCTVCAKVNEPFPTSRAGGCGTEGGKKPLARYSGEVRCDLGDAVRGAHTEILPPREGGDRLRPRVGLSIGVAHV